MTKNYFAKPPRSIWQGKRSDVYRSFFIMLSSFATMLWCAFTPFKDRPDEPLSFPDPEVQPSTEQVAQCQAIFDEAEDRRNRIEQKAQWAFAVIAFLAPFLASLVVFIFNNSGSMLQYNIMSLALLLLSAFFVLLSFFSAARALSIRPTETLHLNAVIDNNTGQFREYKAGLHAQGLLYCAVINTAMNDHIAQLVKGAHAFAVGGLICFICGAIPAGLLEARHKEPINEEKIVGGIEISSSDMDRLSEQIRKLIQEIADQHATTISSEQLRSVQMQLVTLQTQIAKLEISRTQSTNIPPSRSKSVLHPLNKLYSKCSLQ